MVRRTPPLTARPALRSLSSTGESFFAAAPAAPAFEVDALGGMSTVSGCSARPHTPASCGRGRRARRRGAEARAERRERNAAAGERVEATLRAALQRSQARFGLEGPGGAVMQTKITTRTLVLDLDRFDAAFAQPLFAQLSVIGPNALLLAVGGQPLPFALMHDAAVAMPVSPCEPRAAARRAPPLLHLDYRARV